MKKIFYTKDGFVCNRYPHDYSIDGDSRFIEVDNDTFNKTLSCDVGYIWSVINGKLGMILDPDETETRKRITIEKSNQLATVKAYLNDTDYVISKLNELQLEDDDSYQAAKAKYADVLKKRKEAREQINILTTELEELTKQKN